MANPPLSGLALPAVKVNGGYFSARRIYDVSWGDLILALFTPRGGRLMRRSAGSELPSLLMSPLDSAFLGSVANAVRDAAAAQCPHIRLIAVDVKPAQTQGSLSNTRSVDVVVSFTTSNDRTQVQTHSVRLDRRSVLQAVRAFQVARGAL